MVSVWSGEARWILKQFPGPGAPDLDFEFGEPDGVPVVGDWNGNGVDSVGRFKDGNWTLRDQPGSGSPDYSFTYGAPGSIPVVWGRIAGG